MRLGLLAFTLVCIVPKALFAEIEPASENKVSAETGSGLVSPLFSDSLMMPLVKETLLLDITSFKSSMVSVGERGHVIYSHDDGASWKQAKVPLRVQLNGVRFIDEDQVWAVGHNGSILKSTDGGKTWSVKHLVIDDDAPLMDIWFDAQGRGLAIGAYGVYYRTEDGGESWDESFVHEEDDFHLNAVTQHQGVLFIAAEAGRLYKSTDIGETWTSIQSPYHGSFFHLLSLPRSTQGERDRLIVLGLRGKLYYTDDMGLTWEQPPQLLSTSLFKAVGVSGHLLVVGAAGVILKLDDGLNEVLMSNEKTRSAFVGVATNSEGQLFAVGEKGIMKFSDQLERLD